LTCGARTEGARPVSFRDGEMSFRLRSGLPRLAAFLACALALAACGPRATPTYFIPPTLGSLPNPPPAYLAGATSTPEGPAATAAAVPTIILPTPTPPCTNGLTYVQDLTVPDGTNYAPGQPIDKQWLVSNNGTCNWDSRYRLKLIGGDAMAAAPLQALYPARAGTQATIRIVFTAPQQAGLYQSQWKAMNPDGLVFGDAFYIQIAVTP
jgi:hypothetical protein